MSGKKKKKQFKKREILEILQDCRSLHGIPKVAFIQACRGQEINFSDAQEIDDSPEEPLPKRPKIADTLVWCSAVEDTLATRNKEGGSWFIQTTFKEIMENPAQGLDVTIKKVTAKAIEGDPTKLWKKIDREYEEVETFPIPCVTHDTRRGDIYFS